MVVSLSRTWLPTSGLVPWCLEWPQPFNNAMVVPGAGLEPATFGCLRHHKGLCTSYDRLEGCPMSPARYQLRHPGLPSPAKPPFEECGFKQKEFDRILHSLSPIRRVMVDLSTAMTAAQGERRQRTQGGDKEKKVRRTGRNLGIEAFDPVKHVQKEKADTASMWLVLAFSLTITLLMRYVLMDSTDPRSPRFCTFSLDMHLPHPDASPHRDARAIRRALRRWYLVQGSILAHVYLPCIVVSFGQPTVRRHRSTRTCEQMDGCCR